MVVCGCPSTKGSAQGGQQSAVVGGCVRMERASEKVGQFVLDDFNGFEDFVLVSCTGDHHLSGAEDEANHLRVVKAINEAWELLGFVFHLVKGQVEGEVVQVEFAWNAGLRFSGELVDAVVVLWVVKGVGGDHVLDFNGDVFEVPGFDASTAQILDHAVNTGVNVVFVLPTGAHGSSGAEHENGEFWFGHAVDHTGKLLWLVFAVELDGDVGEVEFFSNTGAGNNVHNGQAFFIGGHIKPEWPLVYKRNFDTIPASMFRCMLLGDSKEGVDDPFHLSVGSWIREGGNHRFAPCQFDGLTGRFRMLRERHHAAPTTGTREFDAQR